MLRKLVVALVTPEHEVLGAIPIWEHRYDVLLRKVLGFFNEQVSEYDDESRPLRFNQSL